MAISLGARYALAMARTRAIKRKPKPKQPVGELTLLGFPVLGSPSWARNLMALSSDPRQGPR